MNGLVSYDEIELSQFNKGSTPFMSHPYNNVFSHNATQYTILIAPFY